MGLLGGFFKAAVNVATLPVAVVVDVVTAGNAKATENVIDNLKDNLSEAGDAAGGHGDFLSLTLALLLGAGLLAGCQNTPETAYSRGERVGEMVKMTRKGLVYKTWEAELKLQEGGSSDGDNGRWAFTIPDGMAARGQAALGHRVKVSYWQAGLQVNPAAGDTDYHAEEILLIH